MCGRFAFKTPSIKLKAYFGLDEAVDFAPHYNIPPGTDIPVILQVRLECRLHSHQNLAGNTLIIGEVAMFHVADPLVDARGQVRGFAPLGRLGSPSVYCRTADRFEVPRIRYADWLARQVDDRNGST